MASYLHHTPQIGGLLITTQQFLLPITGDNHQRWCIRAHVIKWCELIDTGLCHLHALSLSIGEMADGMTTIGHQSRNAIRIYLVFRQPLFIQADHVGQIAACGMARDKNLVAITAVTLNLTERPSHRRSRIVDTVAQRSLR